MRLSPKKILIVTHIFPPTPGIGGRRWAKFAKYLSKTGNEVSVISAENHSIEKSQWEKDVLDSGIQVHRLPLLYPEILGTNPNSVFQKLHYKIATTYMLEEQWASAVKQLDNAMRIHRNVSEYNLAMGECKMNLNQFKDAVIYFGNVVRHKPKNVAGWEALIRCLFKANYYEEAMEQCFAAIKITEAKPIFIFYYSAALFFLGKSKEALLQFENAMGKAPKLLKKFVELNPSILQNHQVIDIVARYKKSKKL